MNKIKAVIIEDEMAAVNTLKAYLSKYCLQVEVTGEAYNAKEGIKLIHELEPDLVFLDVEMPYGNAFDVLDACNGLEFETIFVTAYSEYALKALNQSAAYYLLKPLSIEDLIAAVEKVSASRLKKDGFSRNKVLLENSKGSFETHKLILPTVDGFDVVMQKQIIRLKGNSNFTDIYLEDGSKKMVCRFLKYFEELLELPFIRVHKSHIINLNFLSKYHKGSGGYVVLQDGSEVEVSATYKELFLDALR